MTLMHDIVLKLSEKFHFEPTSDDPKTQELVGKLLTIMLERLVGESFKYLSTEDQQIVDGMIDANATPESVLMYLTEHVPELPNMLDGIIESIKLDASETLGEIQSE